jgi:pantoate kinase
MGSVGIGATVDQRVTVHLQKSVKTEITFNGQPIRFPTVLHVINSLTSQPLKISLTSPLPLGYGFGISGASALACAFAVNKLLDLKKTEEKLIEIAHTAEIINKTGLGSVGTQATGGFLFKTAPGIPVSAISFPFEKQKIYAVIIGQLLTPSVLNDDKKLERINTIADRELKKIRKLSSPFLKDLLDISYEFVRESNLANQNILHIIEEIRKNGGHATMAILGYVVFSDQPPDTIKYPVIELTVTKSRVTLL